VKVSCLQDVSGDRAALVYKVSVSSKDGGYAWVVVSNRLCLQDSLVLARVQLAACSY
jgi:hypothetical protein